jgi:hypothetical protein
MNHQITTRKEALKAGFKKYYTGLACSHGHLAMRAAASGSCLKCTSLANTLSRNSLPADRRAWSMRFWAPIDMTPAEQIAWQTELVAWMEEKIKHRDDKLPPPDVVGDPEPLFPDDELIYVGTESNISWWLTYKECREKEGFSDEMILRTQKSGEENHEKPWFSWAVHYHTRLPLNIKDPREPEVAPAPAAVSLPSLPSYHYPPDTPAQHQWAAMTIPERIAYIAAEKALWGDTHAKDGYWRIGRMALTEDNKIMQCYGLDDEGTALLRHCTGWSPTDYGPPPGAPVPFWLKGKPRD